MGYRWVIFYFLFLNNQLIFLLKRIKKYIVEGKTIYLKNNLCGICTVISVGKNIAFFQKQKFQNHLYMFKIYFFLEKSKLSLIKQRKIIKKFNRCGISTVILVGKDFFKF